MKRAQKTGSSLKITKVWDKAKNQTKSSSSMIIDLSP